MLPTRISVLAVLVATVATFASPAVADDEFDVTTASGRVTVTARSGWHINKDYPWKLVVGDTSLDKAKFALAGTTAVVDGAPKGAGFLKGAVCSADQCHAFKKEVTIP
jgi:hypothetical protein